MARLGMFQAPDLSEIRRNKKEVAETAQGYELALEELKNKGTKEAYNIAYGPESPSMITAQTGQEELNLYNKVKEYFSGNIDKTKKISAGEFVDKLFSQQDVAKPSNVYGNISRIAPEVYSNTGNINFMETQPDQWLNKSGFKIAKPLPPQHLPLPEMTYSKERTLFGRGRNIMRFAGQGWRRLTRPFGF